MESAFNKFEVHRSTTLSKKRLQCSYFPANFAKFFGAPFHGKRSSDCFCYAKFNLGHWSTSLVPMLHFIQKAADVKYGKTLKLKKNWHEIGQHLTVWKVSECRVFSGPYFPIIQNEYRGLLVFGHFLKNIYKKESFYWKRFICKIIYILGWSILMVITCVMMINLLRPGVH